MNVPMLTLDGVPARRLKRELDSALRQAYEIGSDRPQLQVLTSNAGMCEAVEKVLSTSRLVSGWIYRGPLHIEVDVLDIGEREDSRV